MQERTDLSKLNHGGLNDPNVHHQMLMQLRAANRKKNIITRDEFSQYELLFKNDGVTMMMRHGLSEDAARERLRSLGVEWMNRFDMYQPVTIVESEDDPTIVFMLPAVFHRNETFGEIGEQGGELATALNNTLSNENDLFDKKKIAYTKQAIWLSNELANKPENKSRRDNETEINSAIEYKLKKDGILKSDTPIETPKPTIKTSTHSDDSESFEEELEPL